MRIRVRFFVSFVFILLFSCQPTGKHRTIGSETILISSENIAEKDPELVDIIKTYRESLEEDMNRLLAYSAHVMERGTPEGKLNNFVADLVFETGQQLYQPIDESCIDFCLLNYGGLRVPIPAGEVTYARVFELLPFENEMVVITLTGEKTKELFEYLANSSVGMPIAGARFSIKNNSPLNITIQDQDFDPERNYKVLTSDYLAGGGDSMNFFLAPLDYHYLGLRVRDAIIQYMHHQHQSGKEISASLDGRITIIE